MFPVLPWEDPFGLASMVAEALFIILGASVLRTRAGSANNHHPGLLASAPALVGTRDRMR
jgi:hypothetical protein